MGKSDWEWIIKEAEGKPGENFIWKAKEITKRREEQCTRYYLINYCKNQEISHGKYVFLQFSHFKISKWFSSVQLLSRVRLFQTPWTAAHQTSLSIINSQSLLKLMSIESVMPSNQSHPLLSPSPPAFSLSQHQVFSKESVLCNRWPKYWSFSFSISPSNEYSGLISFRLDRLDLCLSLSLFFLN